MASFGMSRSHSHTRLPVTRNRHPCSIATTASMFTLTSSPFLHRRAWEKGSWRCRSRRKRLSPGLQSGEHACGMCHGREAWERHLLGLLWRDQHTVWDCMSRPCSNPVVSFFVPCPRSPDPRPPLALGAKTLGHPLP